MVLLAPVTEAVNVVLWFENTVIVAGDTETLMFWLELPEPPQPHSISTGIAAITNRTKRLDDVRAVATEGANLL